MLTRRTLLSLVLVASGAPATWIGTANAQTYPFEGRWQQGGNGCGQADLFTAREMRSYGSGGGCKFTRVTSVNTTTYRYEARCSDDTGQYGTSGTIQMVGENRMLQRDRLMQGQATTYTRC